MEENVDVVIIGAGFAGLGMGIKLKMQGDESFVILEKANEIGGTWRDNTYPGCGCDIPSLLYSYSFEPNPSWSRSFSRQGEILEYIKHCKKKYKMTPHIRFNSEVTEARFDKSLGRWKVRDQQGNQYRARLLVSAAGPFNAPFIPDLKGRDDFEGESFHSLYWNHDYDLSGKRVAVVGTGASAIQFIPEIANQVKSLHVFQRTAPYIVPKPDEEITEKSQRRFKRFPAYQRFWREFIYWFLEYQGQSQYADNKIRAKRKQVALEHLHNQIQDEDLRKKLTPDYEFGCKRVLISENYYPTLQQDNVELIAEAVREILPNGIVSSQGEKREVDVIIYGTGFYTTSFPKLYQLLGLSGRNLFDIFNERGPAGYLGVAVTDFPNLMLVVGPNSGLGHNSIIHMMESQFNYILDYFKHLKKTPSSNSYLDLKPSVQEAFNEEIQAKLSKMVWSNGRCNSYYLQNHDGKNTSIWPGSTVKYRKRTKRIKISDYNICTPQEQGTKEKVKPLIPSS